MATEKRLIEANTFEANIRKMFISYGDGTYPGDYEAMIHDETLVDVLETIEEAPTVDAVEVVHGQRLYNAHEVAEIIAELFGDCCACNFNGIDEWLPLKCELQDACPFPVGVACWEQYLKYRSAKMDGDGNG